MSFFEDASIVLIPSGIKNQKIYSVKPTDGTGDLTFSRASSATRVASNGLIEKVRTNLVLYSQEFDNAYWAKINSASATANTAVAPNGTTTADTITGGGSSSTSRVRQSFAFVAGAEYAISIYVKANDSLTGRLATLNGGGTTRTSVTFTNTSGVVAISGSTGGGVTDIEDVGSGWYRISHQIVINDQTTLDFFPDINGTNLSWYAWGAMIETGVLTPYIGPTTTAAVSVGPVSGLPRLDYLGSTCPRLLLEPQRSNLVTFSEQFDNAAWTKNNSPTITTNIATAPDGYSGADGIQSTDALNYKSIAQTLSVSANSTMTISVFVKKETSETAFGGFYIYFQGATPKIVYGIVNAVTGTVTYASSTLTPTTKVESYGNYWRIASTATDTGSNTLCEIGYYGSLSANGTSISPAVGSVRTLWGFQAEVGAYATSYIPTLGASVTRVADAASKTGISSLIGQTEGVVFVEFNNRLLASYPNEYIVQIISGTTQLWLRKEQGGASFTARLIVSGSTIWTFASSIVPINGNNKIAIAYKTGDSAVFLNGAQVSSTNTSAFSGSAFADLNFNFGGTLNPELPLSQALLFTTRLTNESLAELTSL
jgi:hypothetical protein